MTGPRLLTTYDDLVGARPDDLLLRQLAAQWIPDRPAYAYDGAVGLWHRYTDHADPDLVLVGPTTAVVTLAETFGVAQLSVPVAAAEPVRARLGLPAPVGWAFRWTDTAPPLPREDVAWLPPSADDEVAKLLADAFPDASMPVGHPDVRRWAGLRRDGRLVACLADATSAPGLGFVASIATYPDARGTGAGTAVTAWATAALVAEHGACGLWHMQDNPAAVAMYDRLGYRDDARMAYFPNDAEG